MRTQKRTRFLSALMALLMVFSLLPASALAADVTSTWEPVNLADITPSDTVAITMTKDSDTWALPAAKATGAPAAKVAAVADGQLTIDAAAADYGWTITASDGSYQIKNANGDFLYATDSNNGVRVGSTEDFWSIDNGYLKEATNSRYLGVYTTNPDWRSYTSINNNIAGQTLQFWKLTGETEPEPTEEPTEQTMLTKLDAAPTDGDTVYIYYPADGMMLTGTASGKKLAGVAAERSEDQLVLADSMAALKVSVAEDVYTFALADGTVLTSAETGNGLSFAAPAENDLAKWKLEQQTDGTWYLMNVGAAYNDQHNQALEYYSGFTTYGVKADNAAYKFEFYADINTDPVSGLKTGDKVAIFNDESGKALTATADGAKLVGADAALNADGKLAGEGVVLLTVTVNDDGTVLFEHEGKALTSGATGNGISFAEAANEFSLWVIEDAGDGLFFLKNANAAYNGNAQYFEFYNGFTTYGKKATAAPGPYAVSFRQTAEAAPPVPSGDSFGLASKLADGDEVILFNAKNGVAVGNTIASHKITGVTFAPTDGVITTDNDAVVWTVSVNSDGTYTFKQGDYTLGGVVSGTYNNLVVTDAAFTSWTLTGPDSSDFNYFLRLDDMENNYGKTYLEYYNGFTLYGSSDPTKDAFGITFYKKGAAPETPSGEQPAGAPIKAGDKVVIYSAAAGGSLGLDDSGLNTSLGNIPTDITEGTAYPDNGAYVFTVGVEGDYYTFSAGGKFLSTCDGEQLFLADEKLDTGDSCAFWQLEQKNDGYLIKSKTARYNGTGVVVIEFFSGAFSGWTYKSADPSIFIFNFYPVDESTPLLDDVTNDPGIIFYASESPIKQREFVVTFRLNDLTPLENLTVTANLNNKLVENLENDGKTFSFIVPAEFTAAADALNITVHVANANGTSYFGALSLPIQDIPIFDELTPAPGSKTGDDLTPVISAKVFNALDTDQATITVNGVEHAVPIHNGRIVYQPTEPLKEGRVTVRAFVLRDDLVSNERSWSFTVGDGGEQLYFGQLHSHTTYSDGSGSLDTALDYIRNLPESANVQFVAFTDHSNYFDSNSAANPEGALYDMSLATASSQELWKTYRQTVADFNASQNDVVAIAGFEMTWSGGPGHINTFNSPGIVSRNNVTLNQKTNDAGMKAYYALLDQEQGAQTLSQFNHPGKTFGNFTDFSYWDAVTDSRMFMVEVGNGEGQIGAGGYYPSYEQYVMALDKGWHVAPTNNQDNHKGRWGNANDARDVILTEDFSEQGIYDAIRAMRMYATEDKNLEIYYNVNGQPLGSTISEIPDQLELNVQVSDPDKSDSISKVEVVVNSGKTVHSFALAEINSGSMSVKLAPDYSYYFIRVTEGDGDIAVTAPVWVGETLKLGISALTCGTSSPVTGEELTLTTTVFNSEAAPATVKSITYTTSGSVVLHTDTVERTVPANGTLDVPFSFTPDKARLMRITATVVLEQNGKEFTFTKEIELDVLDAEKLVYIGIDASHHNEYVAGNYKDSMSNFGALASGFGVRTVELKTSTELIAACSNEKFAGIVLTAPSRRDGSSLRTPYDNYTDAEIAALVSFNASGGMIVVTGWSDYYEHYSEFPAADHMAAQQNRILAALGSSLRIADDGTNDDVLNGGQTPRLYFDTYNMDNPLLQGVVVDPEHPNDRAYSEVFSHYGGASIYVVDGSGSPTVDVPNTVSPAVYAHATTYSADSDNDGLGGSTVPKYPVGENDSRLLVMATEKLAGKGMIVVSGAAFLSNFEVQAAVSSGSDDADQQKNYSNYKICENLVKGFNEVEVSDISDVRAQTEEGYKFDIEGVVTSNASGYDKDTAFFDCIYVQDETGGICCFPVAGQYKIGDRVHIVGYTDFYQGEPELQVAQITRLSEGEAPAPREVSAAAINDRSAEGMLVTLKGTVESFELENGLVQTIMVKDAKGDVARVFIDGYITTAKDVENLAEGVQITVTGLASYDDTFKAPTGPFPRIRVRDRADVVCTAKHKCAVFKDIEGHWAQQSICYVVEHDIMNGLDLEKGVFGPNENVTRGMVVTVLHRLEGAPAPKQAAKFTDLKQDWYRDAVAWAAENGIAKGRSDAVFDPDAAVTRAELVTFLMRYAQFKGEDVSGRDDLKQFTDRGAVPSWALDAMQWAVKAGVVNGVTTTTLVPGGTANRAQLATVLARMMQKGA